MRELPRNVKNHFPALSTTLWFRWISSRSACEEKGLVLLTLDFNYRAILIYSLIVIFHRCDALSGWFFNEYRLFNWRKLNFHNFEHFYNSLTWFPQGINRRNRALREIIFKKMIIMKERNLVIYQFWNFGIMCHSREAFHKSQPFFSPYAKARAKLSPFENIFMDYLQISALIIEAIYFLSSKTRFSKTFFIIFMHICEINFSVSWHSIFIFLQPKFAQPRSFSITETFSKKFYWRFLVYKKEVETVWEKFIIQKILTILWLRGFLWMNFWK